MHPLCTRPLISCIHQSIFVHLFFSMPPFDVAITIVLCDRDDFLRTALIEIPDDGDLIRGIDGTIDRERVLHI